MPLVVVPVAAADAGSITLAEWDLLRRCSAVWFEIPDHPLMDRLAAEGVACGPFDDEPAAAADGYGLVADPLSGRVVALARAGAMVTSGPAEAPDALSAAHGAAALRGAVRALGSVAVVTARLRSVDGCPWDQKQTHKSLEAHLLEESYEVIDAIERDEGGPGLKEELGDILLQVAFHARIAQQEGRFDLAAVGDTLVAKLIRRHPHVFGDVTVADADEVLRNWETIKRSEKANPAEEEAVPRSLPALLAAYKAQKRAARHGFAPTRDAAAHAAVSALESDDVGAALFWVVAVARALGIEPETALVAATARFRSHPAGGGADPTA